MNYPTVKVYPAEQEIASLVSKGYETCDAVCLIEENLDVSKLLEEAAPQLVLAEDKSDFINLTDDVMPISSILVTNIWNRNDAIFTAGELIGTYQTAQFKPINWGHKGSESRGNENIGVMVRTTLLKGSLDKLEAFAAEDSSNVLKDIVDGTIHIRQDGIIWSTYFPSYASNIKKGKESGELYVSMECLFKDFGYGIRECEGAPIKLIDRTDANAHLSKSLRCFGGTGKVVYEGKEVKIGRWPKDITFSGQGIVQDPANSYMGKKLSIIFSSVLDQNQNCGYNSEDNKNLSTIGVSIDMTTELEKQLAEVTKKYDEAIKKIASLEESALKAEVDKIKQEKTALETEKSELTAKVTKLETDVEGLNKIKAQFDEQSKNFETVNKELSEIRATETARTRLGELQAIAGDKYGDGDLNDIKTWDNDKFALVKSTLIKAGVSSQAKLTDQTVSGEKKLTEQTVSGETKLTVAATESVKTAEVAKTESTVVVTKDEDEDSISAARVLVAKVIGNKKSKK